MALTIRPNAALREQLDAIARAQGQSVNQYMLSLVRTDVNRRTRLAMSCSLHWTATDAEIADALGAAVSAPLTDIEQQFLPGDPTAAVAFAAGRAAKRRGKGASKPAPSPSSKPPAQRASAAPSRPLVLSSSEYGRLLAVRAKRAGKPAPDRQPPPYDYSVRADDADAQAIVAARKRGGR